MIAAYLTGTGVIVVAYLAVRQLRVARDRRKRERHSIAPSQRRLPAGFRRAH